MVDVMRNLLDGYDFCFQLPIKAVCIVRLAKRIYRECSEAVGSRRGWLT